MHRGQSGQTLILFTLMITAFIGVVALTVDVGMAYRERSSQQNAADAAALAAADVLYAGGSIEGAEVAARALATANGYTDEVDGKTVTVNIPPTSGDYDGQANFAEVKISGDSQNQFASVFNIDAFHITGRAVAGGLSNSGAFGIISLNPTVCRAIDLNGTIDIVIHAAGIFDNSSCPDEAFYANGNVTVITDVNAIVGGWTGVGTVSIEPTPINASAIYDPLADLPPPTKPTTVRTCPTFQGNPGTVTLLPGVYNCTIDPTGPWNVIFQAGNYYITGGVIADGGGNVTFGAGEYTLGGEGLRVTGSGRITVNFAVIYIEAGSTVLTGNGNTRITAPITGPYTGIAIFQNRELTTEVNLQGTSFTNGHGTVYAPAAKVQLTGNTTSSDMQFISDTFRMSGNSSLDLTYTDQVEVVLSRLRLVE